MSLKKKFLSNLSYAFLAQLLTMVISIGINLILPKFLGIESYSYWQLFIFYSQYIPFFHLGINDGVYLRYGGIPYSKLDYSKIKSQMFLSFLYQLSFCIVLCIGSWQLIGESNRVIIIMLACLYFIIYTMQNFIGYIFQAANETSWFSKSIMLNRLTFLILMIFCLFVNIYNYWTYIIAYIIAQLVAMIYSVYKGKSIIRAKLSTRRETAIEMLQSISVGSKLMLANIASMLILGIGRQLIDIKWGIVEFGKISFSITLANFALTFIQQVSMVMFPMLRQLKSNKQKQIYELCRVGLFFSLPIIFIVYFPVKSVLTVWLPEYADSLQYLALILPICFFDTKMQMLCNTYFKVQRKENLLFRVNLVAMLLSLCFSGIGVFIIQRLDAVVLGMVLAIALRSLIAEYYLSKSMGVSILKSVTQEILVVIIFMYIAWYYPDLVGIIVIIIVYLLLIVINYKLLIQWKYQLTSEIKNN